MTKVSIDTILYTGSRPPQRSYELVIKDMDLFAFTVQGSILVDVVYLKFSIKMDYCYIPHCTKIDKESNYDNLRILSILRYKDGTERFGKGLTLYKV